MWSPSGADGFVRPARTATTNYGLAALALAVALGLRVLLDPWIGRAIPLVTVFGAVAAAVWLAGRWAAVAVALLGYAGCLWIVARVPGPSSAFADAGGVVGLGAFLFTSALIIAFGESARAEQRRARDRGETLRVTLRSIGDGVITTDVAGRVTAMNAVAETLTGWPEAEAMGQPLETVFRIVNEDTRVPVENPALKALRHGTIVGLANHTVLIRKNGGDGPIDDSAAPIRDEHGRVSGCVLTFRDVTAQRAVERERAEQLRTARLLASIIESSDDAIVSKSLDGIIETWNAGAERIFGYTSAEAVGRHITLVIPPERHDEEARIIATLRAGRRIDHFETERVRADGTRLTVSLTVSPIHDAAGRVVGASKIVRDITRQRRAEADREKFVTLIENSQDFIGMCDLDGVPFFVNRAGLALVGLDSLDEARRTTLPAFFFPEDQPRIVHEFLPSVLARGQGEIEIRFRHFKTGAARWMAYKALTLPGADGRPIGFATVSQDVTARKALEDDLRRLAADLSEADRRKNEFLATLAHELRNPLAPISNAVRAMRMRGGPADQAALDAASDMLERQVGQMARLVNDLLDVSRISRGKIALRRGRVELSSVVDQAVETVRPLLAAMQHELTVTLPPQPVYVDADAGRLAQALGNLLNNACKFTDRGGHVAVVVEHSGGQAVIRVRDDGIGIAAEHVAGLFEMFAQVDTSLERSRDGLGIGLTLVKTLVELHGGTVEVHSDGPGRGSEFTVRLPALAAAEATEAGAPPPGPAPAPIGPRRVLIVDDSRDGAESLALLLQLAGHETHLAHDGAEAVALAERLRPDVVLLDIGLPVLNGYDACRRIRSAPWGRPMTLVALTGWGQDDDRERSREAGFDHHLVKPVDHAALLALLAGVPPVDQLPAPA
jgi:PAS domain S-box-containing protein